jgi:hypothetical protein
LSCLTEKNGFDRKPVCFDRSGVSGVDASDALTLFGLVKKHAHRADEDVDEMRGAYGSAQ